MSSAGCTCLHCFNQDTLSLGIMDVPLYCVYGLVACLALLEVLGVSE